MLELALSGVIFVAAVVASGHAVIYKPATYTNGAVHSVRVALSFARGSGRARLADKAPRWHCPAVCTVSVIRFNGRALVMGELTSHQTQNLT
jgi:hypothetical protein